MFSKKKRTMSLLLVLTMLLVTLCGCGAKDSGGQDTAATANTETETQQEENQETGSQETGVDISEEVTLVMYLIGDRPVDNDEVFAKINERLKAEINATIEVKFMSWSEYEQKYPLIFASGEDWDIIYTADWCFYNAQATKQGFYEITEDALKTYAPMTAETMYPEAWEQAKVDGKVYMLPMNYMDAIVQNEPSLIPIDVGSDYDKLFLYDRMWKKANWESDEKVVAIGPWQVMGSVSEVDDSVSVVGTFAQPAFLEVITRLKDWKDRGFWSKNAVVNTQNNTESFQAGRSALAMMNGNTAKSVYASVSAEHPEWDIRVFDAQDGVPPVLNSYLANGMSIFSKSKHPERALMALDYLRNDEEINSLFCYGIEGKHWEDAGDGLLISLPDSSNYAYDSNCNWGVRNDANWRMIEGGIPNLAELNAGWQETARSERYQTFVFNDESVKNEIAALGEIFDTDYKLLGLGFTDDPEADIEKLREKMEAAGAQKVYDEIQKQALAFLEAN